MLINISRVRDSWLSWFSHLGGGWRGPSAEIIEIKNLEMRVLSGKSS